MDSIVKEAAQELESRLSIENVTSSTISTLNNETTTCIKRVQGTFELTTKIQTETELIQQMLTCLNEKNDELQATFEKIDQLEVLVNKVKDTYNAVAENVDSIEKAVSASTPFRLGNRNIPAQPYFPPPRPVEIFNTSELFSSSNIEVKEDEV